MILVELYSKDDCQLCEEAKEVLEKVRQEIPYTLHEIMLKPGEEFYEEYKEQIPVVHIDKRFAFKFRVNEHMFKIRLQQVIAENSRPSTTGDREPGAESVE
ncbi:MAG: glutaredoxin family protein [Ignavibacteriae bacterium]|nr:glutaredoxin family protein [Ignavibacteriota bacterium]